MKTKHKPSGWKRCTSAPKFVIGTWSLFDGLMIEEDSNSMEELLKEIPRLMTENPGEELYLCSVDHWTAHDGTYWGPFDAEPHGVKPLYIVRKSQELEDEEAEEDEEE